ncbi:MAG: hypothetical protein H7336_12415 [Bacteriovorax sp.]|nr:hypothetical protein [Bacteriovorax sp.]
MKKNDFLSFLLIISLFSATTAFSQTTKKKKADAPIVKSSNVTTDVNEEEENSNSAATNEISVNTHSVKFKKKPILPAVIAPAPSSASANCADNLGGGGGNFTACEAGKKDR